MTTLEWEANEILKSSIRDKIYRYTEHVRLMNK